MLTSMSYLNNNFLNSAFVHTETVYTGNNAECNSKMH